MCYSRSEPSTERGHDGQTRRDQHAEETPYALHAAATDPSVRDAFIARYDALIAAELAANPPPIRGPRRRSRIKQAPTRNLLERLLLSKEHVLAFLDDPVIPFDNNQAERDLRMLKVQQKVSGGFRAATGSDAFARIRGYLSTFGKRQRPLLLALAVLYTAQSCRLSLAWTATNARPI